MIRGAIVWVNLEDVHPPEFGKTRPALVISNSEQNAILNTVVVIPISTRPPEIWPLRLEMPPVSGMKRSYAVIPGIRQVSKKRLLHDAGVAPDAFLDAVHEALAAYLGD